jgi:hypothetical protein
MHSIEYRAGVSMPGSGQGSVHLLGAFRKNGAKDDIRAGPSVYMTKMTFQGSRQSPVVAIAASTRIFVHGAHCSPLGYSIHSEHNFHSLCC